MKNEEEEDEEEEDEKNGRYERRRKIKTAVNEGSTVNSHKILNPTD